MSSGCDDSVQHGVLHTCCMRVGPCSMRDTHPPYTPRHAARLHACPLWRAREAAETENRETRTTRLRTRKKLGQSWRGRGRRNRPAAGARWEPSIRRARRHRHACGRQNTSKTQCIYAVTGVSCPTLDR
jgi:hypothetical protein